MSGEGWTDELTLTRAQRVALAAVLRDAEGDGVTVSQAIEQPLAGMLLVECPAGEYVQTVDRAGRIEAPT